MFDIVILNALSDYGWIILLCFITKITWDILQCKKAARQYEWTIFTTFTMFIIIFVVKFQIGAFLPINTQCTSVVKEFLMIKEIDGTYLTNYYGLRQDRGGYYWLDFKYNMVNSTNIDMYFMELKSNKWYIPKKIIYEGRTSCIKSEHEILINLQGSYELDVRMR